MKLCWRTMPGSGILDITFYENRTRLVDTVSYAKGLLEWYHVFFDEHTTTRQTILKLTVAIHDVLR